MGRSRWNYRPAVLPPPARSAALRLTALLTQRAAEEVRSGTCLHPNQRGLQVGGKRDQLLLGELLLQQNRTGGAEGYEVKGRLAKIDTNGMNLHTMILLEPAKTIAQATGKIKRRTISLTDDRARLYFESVADR